MSFKDIKHPIMLGNIWKVEQGNLPKSKYNKKKSFNTKIAIGGGAVLAGEYYIFEDKDKLYLPILTALRKEGGDKKVQINSLKYQIYCLFGWVFVHVERSISAEGYVLK